VPKRISLDEAELVRAYDSGMSTTQLAERFGCSVHCICDRLRERGVVLRSSGLAAVSIDNAWLRDAYLDRGISSPQIASLLGVGTTTVCRRLRALGIQSRDRQAIATDSDKAWLEHAYLVERAPVASIAAELGCSKNCVFRTLRRLGIEPRTAQTLAALANVDTEWLRQQYVDGGRSSYGIAAELGCDSKTVWRMLRDRGIETRSRSETMRALGRVQHWGESNPNYRDGSSNERDLLEIRYRWDEVRLSVFTRDRFLCVRCGARSAGRGTLHAHHVRPWAGHEELRINRSNLVTLCRPCHRWVHSKANNQSDYLEP